MTFRPPACRHCAKGKVSRPRGLCWVCYYTPGVCALYGSTSKFAPGPEPTQEQVDRTVAEQLRNLPDWWHTEAP